MNKERIIYVTVLLAVFAGCFAVYQFYFKAKLEKYAEDKALLTNLNKTYTDLAETFRDEDPETVTARYRSVVESWRDAIDVRVPYFTDADWRQHENPPEDVFILQFWYGEQTREMTFALWEKAQAKYGAQVYQRFPADVQTMLGVPYAEQWQGYDITRELVTEQLERLSYGISAFELLMRHNAEQIRQVTLYEPTSSGFIGPEVQYARMGLSFVVKMKDLVELVEELRAADHYFSIEGMKIAHQYIGVDYEPQMEVELYLRRTKPKTDLAAVAGTTAGAAGGSAESATQAYDTRFQSALGGPRRGLDIDDEPPPPEPGPVGKFWKWFKRTVLFTN